MKIRNWIVASIAVAMVLILQGCMLMHFVDDHHSEMMGHGKETPEGNKDSGHHPVANQAEDMLDKRFRTDSQGGMIIEIQFKELTEKGELAFGVKMNDHVIGINQYALDSLAFLANDQGIQVQASRWQSITLSPQRVSGTLYFPAKDDSGRQVLDHGTRNVTLTIKDLGEFPERVFQWNLTSGH